MDFELELFGEELQRFDEIRHAGEARAAEREDDERVVFNHLHWPWENGLEIPWGDNCSHETLARPAFFRTFIVSTGINRAARLLVQDQGQACPYCRQRFRNPAAMALHVRDAHDPTAALVFEEIADPNYGPCPKCRKFGSKCRCSVTHERSQGTVPEVPAVDAADRVQVDNGQQGQRNGDADLH